MFFIQTLNKQETINKKQETSMSSKSLTFIEKEERKLRKKVRQEEARFKKSGDEGHLRKRDTLNDEANNIRENIVCVKKVASEKKKVEEKSDDQLINEAIRQNRRDKNIVVVKKDEKKEEVKTLSVEERDELVKKIKMKMKTGNKNEMKALKEEYDEMVEKDKGEEATARVLFSNEYLLKFPGRSESAVQKEFVKHKKAIEKGENLKNLYVQNMCDMNGKDPEEFVKNYATVDEVLRKKNKGLLEREIIELLEEELTARLIECNCRIKFVEEVIKMTGASKEEMENEYDEDYKKFNVYSRENGFTKKVSVDKYVELSNQKLQVANFRYMIVNKLIEEKGISVEEANNEFDEMMKVMNRPGGDGEEDQCIECDDQGCNDPGCNDPGCVVEECNDPADLSIE